MNDTVKPVNKDHSRQTCIVIFKASGLYICTGFNEKPNSREKKTCGIYRKVLAKAG